MEVSSPSCTNDIEPLQKRFRLDSQLLVSESSPDSCANDVVPVQEGSQEGASPAAPSSASYRSSNGSVVSSDSPVKEEEDEQPSACEILHIISQNLLGSVFQKAEDLLVQRPTKSLASLSSSPTPPQQMIPGALAVAQSPAAALFAEDDWSWHRNPAAAIRSGGTNKQTPVWKYFVYSKVENLSRCIVGDCTYMLKGPHTSTLACHLKKHTKEYAEFQRLKAEYSRTKVEVQSVPMKEPKKPQSPMPEQARPQKPKKEVAKGNDLSAIMSQFRNGGQPPVTSPTQMPNLLMMGMNPLQMMLQNSMPSNPMAGFPSVPTSNNNNVHSNNNNNNNHLAAAGLTVTPSGQIIQSRKWRRDEKKQRDVEIRLALALATSHVPFEVLQNNHWRELFECVQPKFYLPEEQASLEQTMTTVTARMTDAIRSTLQSTSKMVILVDVAKLSEDDYKTTVSAVVPTATIVGVELQTILLGLRTIQAQCDNIPEEISKCVDGVLADYSVNPESIVRIVCSGIGKILGDDDCNNILDKQMDSFGAQLLTSLNMWLESNSQVEALKSSIFATVFSIISNPTALSQANRISGGKFDLPLTEPFPILLEALVHLKQAFNLGHVESFCSLSDSQWTQINGMNNICKLVKTCLEDSATIDTAIPTIQKILIALDKDLYQVGEMASELRSIIVERMSYILDPKSESFDASFLKATALNPKQAYVLSGEQAQLAKKLIIDVVTQRSKASGKKRSPTSTEAAIANVMRLTGNSMCEEFLQHCAKAEEEDPAEPVNNYFAELTTQNSMENLFSSLVGPAPPPLNYWRTASKGAASQYLAELASELLIIPASTVTTQRVLSFQSRPSPFSNVTSYPVNSESLEKQTILRFNRVLLNKIL